MEIEKSEPSTKMPFTIKDVAQVRSISEPSARVYATRKSKTGEFIRLKNGLYISGDQFDKLDWIGQLKLANWIQVPSYISLLTALSFYELTTQIPTQRIESIAQKRTYSKTVRGIEFDYFLIKKDLYGGFTKLDGLFIASPEKALADAIYLCSFGKYALDINALDLKNLNKGLFKKTMSLFPKKTRTWWGKYGPV